MKPGDVLGRYEVISLLARGGMAEVWRARIKGESGFRKELVLKTILPHLAEDPEFESMFINEALLAARLNHPNVVQIFDLGKVDGQFFIVMENVPGFSLRQIGRALRKRKRAMPPWFLLRAVVDICEGLQYAHDLTDDEGQALNIVHRDISPENIMVSRSGLVKVLDFGVAKAATGASSTKAGTLKGKYAYIPPELIQGKEADRRTDVYAIGVMIYELLCGKRPYRGDNELQLLKAVLDAKPIPPSKIYDWIPPDLEKIILRAMHPQRDMRFHNTQQLGDALRLFINQRLKDQHSQRHMGQLVQVLFDKEDKNGPKDTPADKLAQNAESKKPEPASKHVPESESATAKAIDDDDDFDIVDLGSGDIVVDLSSGLDQQMTAPPSGNELATEILGTSKANSSVAKKLRSAEKPNSTTDKDAKAKIDDKDKNLNSSLLDFAESEDSALSSPSGTPSTLSFLQAKPEPDSTSNQAKEESSPHKDKDAPDVQNDKKNLSNAKSQDDAQAIPGPEVESIARAPVSDSLAGNKKTPKWLQSSGGTLKSEQSTPEKTPSWLNTATRSTLTEEKAPNWLSTSDRNQSSDRSEKTPNWLTSSRELRNQNKEVKSGGWPFASTKTGEYAADASSEMKLPKKESAAEPAPGTDGDNPKIEAERFFAAGLVYMREKNEPAAIAQWEQALELDPGNRRYIFNLNRIKEK